MLTDSACHVAQWGHFGGSDGGAGSVKRTTPKPLAQHQSNGCHSHPISPINCDPDAETPAHKGPINPRLETFSNIGALPPSERAPPYRCYHWHKPSREGQNLTN